VVALNQPNNFTRKTCVGRKPRSPDCVQLHERVVVRAQSRRRREHGDRDAHLADVVEERAAAKQRKSRIVESESGADRLDELCDPPAVDGLACPRSLAFEKQQRLGIDPTNVSLRASVGRFSPGDSRLRCKS
jgi:hypothetical protein